MQQVADVALSFAIWVSTQGRTGNAAFFSLQLYFFLISTVDIVRCSVLQFMYAFSVLRGGGVVGSADVPLLQVLTFPLKTELQSFNFQSSMSASTTDSGTPLRGMTEWFVRFESADQRIYG